MIEIKEYKKAEFEETELDSEEFLKGAYTDDAKVRILSIIESEAPITYQLLSKRLINSYKIKRLGSALSIYFDSLISNLREEGKLREEEIKGEIIFHSAGNEDYFRPTPENPEEIRYSYQIPTTEGLNVIIYIFERDKGPFTKKALLEEFSSLLGYKKKGSQVVTLFNKAFDVGKEKGIIKKHYSGKFILNN